jgi:hypothetical protein
MLVRLTMSQLASGVIIGMVVGYVLRWADSLGSLNLERVEPDHTTSRMKALAYRFDDPSY